MSLTELFIIAVGLSMDAFAVAVCKGLAMPRMSWKGAGVVGLYFGGFQGAMPFIGYLLGTRFRDAITAYDHWIAFIDVYKRQAWATPSGWRTTSSATSAPPTPTR